MKPTDRARALLAMAPLVADAQVAEWSRPLTELLAANLGRRLRREALAALVSRWNSLPADVRGPVAASPEASLAARDALHGAAAPVRASVVAFVAAHTWTQTPELLLEALADPDPGVAQAAGASVIALAESAGKDPALAEAVDVLVAMAVESFDVHQSRAVLTAALAVADLPRARGAAWTAAANRQELRSALGGALRAGGSELFRVRAWEHLGQAWLAPAAAARLQAVASVREHEAILGRAHLARRDARARAVAALPARERSRLLAAVAPLNAAVLNKLDERGWVGMASILRTLGDEAGRREIFARAALGHPLASVRFAAMRAAPTRTICDFAFDQDPSIAFAAALECSAGEAPWAALRRSPHERVRQVALDEAGLAGEVWGLSCAALLGLRRRLAADAEGLERGWREAWERAEVAERVVLMRVAARIGLMSRVGGAVVAVARADAEVGSDGARLAATAAVVLGSAVEQVPEAGPALASCLEAKDARVRANAVEAVGPVPAVEPRRVLPVLVELKGDLNHRVRANAVRALAGRGLLPGSAVLREVARLLVSPEGIDRRAGVWLAGRVGAEGGPLEARDRRGVVTMLERRLPKEDDAAVAARMTACAARLMADLEGGGVIGRTGGVALQEAA